MRERCSAGVLAVTRTDAVVHDEWDLGKNRRIDRKIAISRERRHREIGLPDSEVHRLRPDQDDRVAMRAQSIQCIEQDPACQNVKLVDIAHFRQTSSCKRIQSISSSPSAGPRPGLVSRSTAT
jgi:hypothetical protein